MFRFIPISLFVGSMLSCWAAPTTPETFKNPPPEFRPLPIRHSAVLHDPTAMGWLRQRRGGGYVMDAGGNKTPSHADQVGGETFINPTYLNVPENFQALEKIIRQLKSEGRLAWLYDEYAYPSGSAGGQVLQAQPEHAARGVECRVFREGEEIVLKEGASVFSCVALQKKKGGVDLTKARDITQEVRAGGFRFEATGDWTIYLSEVGLSDAWKGHNMSRRLLNVLDRDAVSAFIDLTHEKYAKELGPLLNEVGAIFTDEPQFGAAETWGRTGRKEAPPMIQWTDELVSAFEQKKGYPLQTVLPALFFDLGDKTAKYRYDFYDVQSDLMAENYFGQVEDWCHAHGTLSSGHMLLEESLLFHVMFSGSAFKNWARQDLPGMDLLGAMPYRSMAFHWEPEKLYFKEDLSCKMVSSVAHLLNKPGVFSESFATAKDATLRDVLGTTGWQYSEGITHQFTYTIQNHFTPQEYATYSDFAGRLALFARRGTPVARLGVVAPEASVWAAYNPPGGGTFARYFSDNPSAAQVDHGFRDVCQKLLASQRQFECISEELLRDATVEANQLVVGSMSFSTLVLPNMRFAAPGVLEKLTEFANAGGTVIFSGALPCQNARWGASPKVTEQVMKLLRRRSKNVQFMAEFSPDELTEEVAWTGSDAVRMLVLQDGPEIIVILANPSTKPVRGQLRFPSLGNCQVWNPEEGTCLELAAQPVAIEMGGQTARIVTLNP